MITECAVGKGIHVNSYWKLTYINNNTVLYCYTVHVHDVHTHSHSNYYSCMWGLVWLTPVVAIDDYITTKAYTHHR